MTSSPPALRGFSKDASVFKLDGFSSDEDEELANLPVSEPINIVFDEEDEDDRLALQAPTKSNVTRNAIDETSTSTNIAPTKAATVTKRRRDSLEELLNYKPVELPTALLDDSWDLGDADLDATDDVGDMARALLARTNKEAPSAEPPRLSSVAQEEADEELFKEETARRVDASTDALPFQMSPLEQSPRVVSPVAVNNASITEEKRSSNEENREKEKRRQEEAETKEGERTHDRQTDEQAEIARMIEEAKRAVEEHAAEIRSQRSAKNTPAASEKKENRGGETEQNKKEEAAVRGDDVPARSETGKQADARPSTFYSGTKRTASTFKFATSATAERRRTPIVDIDTPNARPPPPKRAAVKSRVSTPAATSKRNTIETSTPVSSRAVRKPPLPPRTSSLQKSNLSLDAPSQSRHRPSTQPRFSSPASKFSSRAPSKASTSTPKRAQRVRKRPTLPISDISFTYDVPIDPSSHEYMHEKLERQFEESERRYREEKDREWRERLHFLSQYSPSRLREEREQRVSERRELYSRDNDHDGEQRRRRAPNTSSAKRPVATRAAARPRPTRTPAVSRTPPRTGARALHTPATNVSPLQEEVRRQFARSAQRVEQEERDMHDIAARRQQYSTMVRLMFAPPPSSSTRRSARARDAPARTIATNRSNSVVRAHMSASNLATVDGYGTTPAPKPTRPSVLEVAATQATPSLATVPEASASRSTVSRHSSTQLIPDRMKSEADRHFEATLQRVREQSQRIRRLVDVRDVDVDGRPSERVRLADAVERVAKQCDDANAVSRMRMARLQALVEERALARQQALR